MQKLFFFSIWVFFHEHSRFTRQQGKGEGIYLTPLYHFHPLHRHLDISRAITAESSPVHIAGSRTRTGNLWFPSEVANHQTTRPLTTKLALDTRLFPILPLPLVFLFFFNWDSPHARLNSHYEAWSYKKRSTKRITGYRKSV